MLFQTHSFVLGFLPLALGGWLLLRLLRVPRDWLMLYLIGISLFFYGSASRDFLVLLVALTIFNFLLGRWLHEHRSDVYYWFGVIVNLCTLAYYKYTAFAIDNINIWFGTTIHIPAIVLPLAISFFTFQKISYLSDIRRGHVPRYSFMEFGLFVWFFPQLMAGPIVRHSEMIPQMGRLDRRRLAPDLSVGLTLFTIGLMKKLYLADSAALYADMVFDGAAGPAPRLIESWLGAIAYSLQIYFDFSGYTDMAIGLARMFGIRLPMNFFSPYQATSIIEFWRRWHITLSRFLRDYLYVPLGGNRRGPIRRYVNLMTVMLLGGLWHGANWTFVVWGSMHGIYLVINHAWQSRFPGRLSPVSGWFITMAMVVIAWVPFRSASLSVTLSIWSGMIGLNGIMLPGSLAPLLGDVLGGSVLFGAVTSPFVVLAGRFSILMLPMGLLLAVFAPNPYRWLGRFEPALGYRTPIMWGRRWRLEWRPTVIWSVLCAGVLTAAILRDSPQVRFLYWQF